MTYPNIFNIQRFSVHDGPGIRTTVFLKGCPLRCKWCHNPESHIASVQIGYFSNRCTGCGVCVDVCPNKALKLNSETWKISANIELCNLCGKCVDICPTKARIRYGEKYSPEALADILLKDKLYYKNSCGGVTFSGGEPLLYAQYIADVAKLLKIENIPIAIETSAYGSRDAIDILLEVADLFLVDIKAMDDNKHQNMTGVAVTPILENIKYMSKKGAEIIIRIPVITGLNDSTENMQAVSDFLINETNIKRIELLKMHKLAEHKYVALGIQYTAKDIPVPEEETMITLGKILADKGLDVSYYTKEFEKSKL